MKKGRDVMRTTAHEPEPETNVARDTRGSVMVEYLTLTAVVALVIASAAVLLGVPLIRLFHYEQALLLLPVP